MLKDRIAKLEGRANQSGNGSHLKTDYSLFTDEELRDCLYSSAALEVATIAGLEVEELPDVDMERVTRAMAAYESAPMIPVKGDDPISALSDAELDRELEHFTGELLNTLEEREYSADFKSYDYVYPQSWRELVKTT